MKSSLYLLSLFTGLTLSAALPYSESKIPLPALLAARAHLAKGSRSHKKHHSLSSESPRTSDPTVPGTAHTSNVKLVHRSSADVTALISRLNVLQQTMASNQANIRKSLFFWCLLQPNSSLIYLIDQHRQEIKHNPKISRKASYRQKVSDELAAYRAASGGSTPIISQLNDILAPMDRNQGIGNLDPNNQLEVTLAKIIGGTKNTLADIDFIIYKFPLLGKVLGPIV